MIVKPDCPVKLTQFQARRIITQLQVGNYFQSIKGGAETLPPFSGFVNELDAIASQFFIKTDYNFKDFLSDPHNAVVLETVFDELFVDTELNDTQIMRTVLDRVNSIESSTANTVENSVMAAKTDDKIIEEERKGFFDTDAAVESAGSNEFKTKKFPTERSFYNAMFNHSNYLENKFKTKFISDVVIRSLLIDPKTRTLVNTAGIQGELTVNKNLKEKRKEILSRILEGQTINRLLKSIDPITGIETESNQTITLDLAISDANAFNYLMEELENRVTKPTFNGDTLNFLDPTVNSLYIVARAADNDLNEDAAKIVNAYMDYVSLRRFDDILEHSFSDLLYVNQDDNLDNFNDDLKYEFIIGKREEAPNANFTEVIKGLETISDLYNTIITNTQLLDINTGLPLGKDFLTKPKVQRAFNKFFKYVDPTDSTKSIKDLVIKGMHDEKALWEDRNILYTMYKSFFEERGDNHFGYEYNQNNTVEQSAKDQDKYPESYLQTIVYNNFDRQHDLMQLITDPLRNISKITYIDGTVTNETVTLTKLSTTGKTSTIRSIENALFAELNNPEKLPDLIAKYKIQNTNTSLDGHAEFEYNGQKYVIKGTAIYNGEYNQNLPQELITALSKDFLNIDFETSTLDKDFRTQLLSRVQNNTQSIFPDYYVQFLRQGIKVAMAKHAILFDNDIRNAIANKVKTVDLLTGNMLVNSLFTEGRDAIKLKNLDKYIIKFNRSDTLQPVLDAYGASKDRVTGNAAKSVLTNKEGNAITGYSIYNLFTGLERNLIQAGKLHNSIVNHDPSKNVFSHNAIVHDSRLFKGFAYRDAIQVNDKIVANSKQSVLATYNFDINGGYFSALEASSKTNEINVIIDPTVYSDKSKNAMAIFGNDFRLNGKDYKLFLDENDKVTPETQSIELQYQTSGEYYKKYGRNIAIDWHKVINAAAIATGQDQIDFFRNSNSVSETLIALNEFNSGDFWYSNSIHPFLRGRDAALFYASQAGVALNNFVHYQSNGKTLSNDPKKSPLIVKPSLIEEIARYDHPDSSKLKEWLDTKLIADVNQIRKTDFMLTGDSSKFIENQYGKPSLGYWRQGQIKGTKDLYIAIKDVDVVTNIDQILPAYRKFFYDWNFLTDNLLNFALGNIHAHKGMNPNAAWTAMTKRNVMAGASIRPFALGLEKGVEEYTNTAYIDDIITPITTIHGNVETIVDLDGGAFVTMTHRIKSWNSLNQQYQGDGGPEQKPFISNMNAINGQNGMTKFADFVLDKETIRNSIGSDIDFMELHKTQLYNYPINHLDITKSWKQGVDLNNLDMYVYRRDFDHNNLSAGRIEKLERIVNAGGNTYKVLMSNPSVPNSAYTKTVTLNTWFDLWQILGDIDNVAPSKKKTSIYYETPNGTKVYFEESDSSWEKLLDYEAYIGNPNDMMINSKYIGQAIDYETNQMFEVYEKLSGEHDIVIPKLELLAEAAITGEIDPAIYKSLGLDFIQPIEEYIKVAQENSEDIQEFFNHVYNETQKPDISEKMKNWQPIKGKLIDRIATAGAQKFGQFNMNRSATFSKEAREKFMADSLNLINENIPSEVYDMSNIETLLADGSIIEDCN